MTDLISIIFATKIAELVIGIIGNLTVCIVIMCSRSMRTLTDFYLLSLSIADLCNLIAGYVVEIDQIFLESNDGVHSFVISWIFFTSVQASILTVTAFTVERYLAVCHPLFIQSTNKKSRFKKIIFAIWFVAALLALTLVTWLSFYTTYEDTCTKPSEYGSDEEIVECYDEDVEYEIEVVYEEERSSLSFASEAILPYVFYTQVTVCLILPILLITVLYNLIGIKLHRSSIERQNITSQADRTNKKTLIMFAVIILTFVISWTPFFAALWFYCVKSYANNIVSGTTIAVAMVTYPLSSVLNPVIYTLMSEKFRKAFKDLLLKSRKKLSDWTFTCKYTPANEIALEIA